MGGTGMVTDPDLERQAADAVRQMGIASSVQSSIHATHESSLPAVEVKRPHVIKNDKARKLICKHCGAQMMLMRGTRWTGNRWFPTEQYFYPVEKHRRTSWCPAAPPEKQKTTAK